VIWEKPHRRLSSTEWPRHASYAVVGLSNRYQLMNDPFAAQHTCLPAKVPFSWGRSGPSSDTRFLGPNCISIGSSIFAITLVCPTHRPGYVSTHTGSQKTRHYTVAHKFAKCWPNFKILSPADSAVNLQ